MTSPFDYYLWLIPVVSFAGVNAWAVWFVDHWTRSMAGQANKLGHACGMIIMLVYAGLALVLGAYSLWVITWLIYAYL